VNSGIGHCDPVLAQLQHPGQHISSKPRATSGIPKKMSVGVVNDGYQQWQLSMGEVMLKYEKPIGFGGFPKQPEQLKVPQGWLNILGRSIPVGHPWSSPTRKAPTRKNHRLGCNIQMANEIL